MGWLLSQPGQGKQNKVKVKIRRPLCTISLAPVPPRFACPILVAPWETSIRLGRYRPDLRGGENAVHHSAPQPVTCGHPRWKGNPKFKHCSGSLCLGLFRRVLGPRSPESLSMCCSVLVLFGTPHQAASSVSSRPPSTLPSTSHARHRSRSRGDKPVVQRRAGHGRFPPLRGTDWQTARDDYHRDFYAASNQPSVQSRLKFVRKALGVFGQVPLPPTVEKIHSLGVVLKAGGYASAANYFAAYRSACEREGHGFDQQMVRAVRDGVRSATRGLGGPVRAAPLPFERLRDLPGGDVPWCLGGPVGARNFMVLGAWSMMREIEASNALAAHLELIEDAGGGFPKVVFELPASKTDQKAIGAVRSHGCSCLEGFDPLCPAHAAWDRMLLLRRRFGAGRHGALPRDLPLFPTLQGGKCSKEAMTLTIEHAALALRVPLSSPDGSERVSGHSLRVTGAQGMAKLGLDLWAIQLLGRWGSSAVLGYVRMAHLDVAETWARRAAASMPLEEIVKDLAQEPRTPVSTARSLPKPRCKDGFAQTELDDALAHEVLAEKAKEGEKLTVVVSDAGVYHSVLLGPPEADLQASRSVCGWKFGRSGAALRRSSELPASYKPLCQKCFPDLRAALKVEFAQAARSMGEGS